MSTAELLTPEIQDLVVSMFDKDAKRIALSIMRKVGLGNSEDLSHAISEGFTRWVSFSQEGAPEECAVWVARQIGKRFGPGEDPGQLVWEGLAYVWCCKQGGQSIADEGRRRKTNCYADLDPTPDKSDQEPAPNLLVGADVQKLRRAALAIPPSCAEALLAWVDDIPEECVASSDIRRARVLFKEAMRLQDPGIHPDCWQPNLELCRLFEAVAAGVKVFGAQSNRAMEDPAGIDQMNVRVAHAVQLGLFDELSAPEGAA